LFGRSLFLVWVGGRVCVLGHFLFSKSKKRGGT
jgi:hypothetical protein